MSRSILNQSPSDPRLSGNNTDGIWVE
ncbi:RNA polymerase sigma factor SigE, partial [Mycobacteroides abscessus subsp. abscessus]|nr:RNA polymerase sigma factor SigE [Mycobacteroides abscessus subsp. abscessus]